MSIVLRKYQTDAIKKALEHLKSNKRSLISLPTGTGKTVIMSHVIKNFNKKSLVVVHTRELEEQFIKTYKSLYPNDSIGMKMKDKWNTNSNVIISTIQSLHYRSNLDKLRDEGIELLVFDECHHVAANSYQKLITNLGCDKKEICGFTATPYRSDKKDITKTLGLISFSSSLIDMIKDGYLCEIKGSRIYTNISLKGISTQNGDFAPGRLAAVINVQNRNELILQTYLKDCLEEKCICFTVNISHADELCKLFKHKNIKCEVIHGKLSKNTRDMYINMFKKGEIKVLFNCNILTEGFDEPSITTILMARPTLSKSLYTQMVGRGTRIFKNKKFCKVVEFTDNDFNICSLEDLLDSPNRKIKIKEGETLTEYSARYIKELELIGEGLHPENIDLTHSKTKIIYEREASQWQKMKLNSLGIEFKDSITEFEANELINKVL